MIDWKDALAELHVLKKLLKFGKIPLHFKFQINIINLTPIAHKTLLSGVILI